jgi:hypothetical protein
MTHENTLELNKNNYSEFISNLSSLDRLYFYEKLALNITISVRAIWSDEGYTDTEKIEAMKWLNEIQHRIVSKISVERLTLHEWKESDIIDMIECYVKFCPFIGSHITYAIRVSYEKTLKFSNNL